MSNEPSSPNPLPHEVVPATDSAAAALAQAKAVYAVAAGPEASGDQDEAARARARVDQQLAQDGGPADS